MVLYTSYFTFYYDTLLIVAINETPENNSTNIIIIVVVCVIVVLIIVLLVLLYIRRQKYKGNELKKAESVDFENEGTETISNLTSAKDVTHIEEDPFADDFKEDNFINGI